VVDAFAEQVLELRRFLRNYAYRLSDAADAEDLVQDTIERALRHRARFDGRNLKAWLATILRNRAFDLQRRRRRRPLEDLEQHPELEGGDVEREAIAHLELEAVLRAEPELAVLLLRQVGRDNRLKGRIRRARLRARNLSG